MQQTKNEQGGTGPSPWEGEPQTTAAHERKIKTMKKTTKTQTIKKHTHKRNRHVFGGRVPNPTRSGKGAAEPGGDGAEQKEKGREGGR